MDETLAGTYIGKHLLIGMTYLDHDESFLEQKQFYGTIVRVNEVEGIVVKLHNSEEEFKLPPDLNSLQSAPKGEYRLHSTGEVIIDPDLLTTWTLTKPGPKEVEVGHPN